MALTYFIPQSSLLHLFQTTIIFDSAFKFSLVLVWSQPDKFSTIIYCSVKMATTQLTQSAITCSKLRVETLEQGVKYVQS